MNGSIAPSLRRSCHAAPSCERAAFECESAATNVSSLRKFSKNPALQSHSVQCLHARGAVHSHSKRSHSNAVSQSGRVRRHEAPGTADGRARSTADFNTNLSQACRRCLARAGRTRCCRCPESRTWFRRRLSPRTSCCSSSTSCAGRSGRPELRSRARSASLLGLMDIQRLTHYSLLRTIEDSLGLPPLTENDEFAQPMNGYWP